MTDVWSDKVTERNAKITRTMLGTEDHGIMTFFLHLEYDGGGQGFGGYGMDEPVKDENGKFLRRRGTAFGCDAILRVLETLEIENWEDLPGTPCRARAEHTKVHAIGHYLKEKWLSLEELAKEYRNGDEP
jgi:hypothetical protein